MKLSTRAVAAAAGFVVGGVLHRRAYAKSSAFPDHLAKGTQAARAESSYETRSQTGVRALPRWTADTVFSKRIPSTPEDPVPRLSIEEMRERINRNASERLVNRGRIKSYSTCSYPANAAIEDTIAIDVDNVIGGGALFGVFDGHSGRAASAFCRDELFSFLKYSYAEALSSFSFDASVNPPDLVSKDGFLLADACFLTRAVKEGRYSDGLAGACAIVSHVDGDTVTTGNAGDCRSIIARRKPLDQVHPIGSKMPLKSLLKSTTNTPRYEAIELSTDHQIDTNPVERERLLQGHPNEGNVIWRNRVKGRLQPTRGFGDGKYKRMDLFLESSAAAKEQSWTPPYTTAEPDITKHTLQDSDEYMILASDGLFQDLSSQEVVDALTACISDPKVSNASSCLAEKALLTASENRFGRSSADRGLNLVMNIPAGRERRRIHDDVSVVVVSLRPRTDDRRSSDEQNTSSYAASTPLSLLACQS